MEVNIKTQGLIDITLNPGETFFGERGSMSFCDGGVEFTPIETKILTGFYRWLGGESFFSIVRFRNKSNSSQNLKLRYDLKQSGWFHHNTTESEIFHVDLSKVGYSMVVEPSAFFASTKNITVGSFLDKGFGRNLLGFGDIFKQKITGKGVVFLQKDRWVTLEEIWLGENKTLVIDPKEVYGFSLNVLDKKSDFSIKNFLAGEGFSPYNFQGPGLIYVYKSQSVRQGYNSNTKFQKITIYMFIFLIFKLFLSLF